MLGYIKRRKKRWEKGREGTNSRAPANAAMETARTLISIYCSRTAHLSYLSLSVALVACSLLCPPNQMKERRDASKREEKDEMERERERERERENVVVYFSSFSFAEFVLLCLCHPFYILYLALPSYYRSCPCPLLHASIDRLSITA